MQAYLRDIADLVPDHQNKANITIKRVTRNFWFPSTYKSYAYTTLWSFKCVITFCLKKNVLTLIKKYFIDKKCCPSSEPSVSHRGNGDDH